MIYRVTTSCHCQVFIFLRWCVAISSIALFTCGYVYCMEMVAITSIITLLLFFIIIITNLITILFTQVGGVWCTLIGIGLEFPWALGYMSLPLVCFSCICHTFFFIWSCLPSFFAWHPKHQLNYRWRGSCRLGPISNLPSPCHGTYQHNNKSN